ncbi:MAG: hypothetical protein M3Q30_19120 [Actinomycetota bacterium]|nr:hypothetical protein [Actinomycetota bacterium]
MFAKIFARVSEPIRNSRRTRRFETPSTITLRRISVHISISVCTFLPVCSTSSQASLRAIPNTTRDLQVLPFSTGVFRSQPRPFSTGVYIVVHGIDTNHNNMYDFSKGPSDVAPALPQEATVPAACGVIH